jgi:hypothetical protein
MKSTLLSETFTRLKAILALITIVTASLFNTGCSSFSLFSSTLIEKTLVEIVYSSPDRISFQGKGAGAGIALMSSMGPVGIAIGVAIDEGIAKDIRDTAKEGSVDFKIIFNKAVPNIDILKDTDRIDVKKYGFVIKDGSKDYVAAEVHLLIHRGEVYEELVLSSWEEQQALEKWITLEELKKNSNSIYVLFEMALEDK